jgi:hypothetical protein
MKKSKPAPKKAVVAKSMDADDHRKKAEKHRALGRLHEAKADMLDVDNPPKKGSDRFRSY